jgi:hypothetical protein
MQKDTQQPLSDFARHHFGLGRAEGRAEGQAEGRAEGRAEGQAEALLLILEERGVAVPDEALERIRGCTDPAQLEAWVRAALSANDIEDVFDP